MRALGEGDCNMGDKEFNSVLMAGLLRCCDIIWEWHNNGSFLENRKFSYPDDVDGILVDNLVKGRSDDARHLVRILDNAFSSVNSFIYPRQGNDSDLAALISIFSGIKLDKQLSPPVFNNIATLSPGHAFPVENACVPAAKAKVYLDNFFNEVYELMENGAPSFNILYLHIVAVMRKYLWCIAAPGQNNIPLYEIVHVLLALTACIYKYHRSIDDFSLNIIGDDNISKFRLVVGDLSGIQKYIFSIANIGAGGTAKRLRARSFKLWALAEVLSLHVLALFDVPYSNVIMASGGKFYILLPNTPSAEDQLDKLQKELDEWCIKKFNGELVFNLADVVCSQNDIEHFDELLSKIGLCLSQRKAKPLSAAIIDKGVWNEDMFLLPFMAENETSLCRCCRKGIVSANAEQEGVCDDCYDDWKLGTDLANARYVVFYKGYCEGGLNLFADYCVRVYDVVPHKPNPFFVIKLNDATIKELREYPAIFAFIANYIPVARHGYCDDCSGCSDKGSLREGEPIYFDCIANRARGKSLLGYLKADVDNLGSIFALDRKSVV